MCLQVQQFHYSLALAIARASPNMRAQVARVYGQLGNVPYYLGEYEQALVFHKNVKFIYALFNE